MAVLLETSKGDLVIDLFVEDAPMTCKNFLKLCKLKYYNNSMFHNVQRDFIAQTGDPSGTGKGGDSMYGLLYGSQARFFDDEISPKRKHGPKGCVGMASAGPGLNASQFYFTLGTDLSSLDERHTLFGQVSEGLDVLDAMNEAPVDVNGRPLQNIRIRHTIILDDPFDDPAQLADLIPDASPLPTFEHGDRLEEDWVPEHDERPAEEVEKEAAAAEAKSRAVVLEMIGDLPEAEAKPPSNMLFVCKLNPVTTEEDLEIIFSRFGNVTSCDIIRDHKTGDSLCYAFIGYDNDESCEAAYFKMNNVLIDDRRIRVDFSQSVAHIWKQFRRHGKAGGNAGMAAEVDAHARGGGGGGGADQQQQQQRGPPTGSRYLDLKGPRQQQQQQRGMLFDDAGPVHQPAPQQQQQPQRGRQRWDEPHRPSSNKRSPSMTRSRSRGRDRSRSRSLSRDHKHKKHKKQHKKHKEDKQPSDYGNGDAAGRGAYGSSRHDSQRGPDGRGADHRQQDARYDSSRSQPDRGRGDWREDGRGERGRSSREDEHRSSSRGHDRQDRSRRDSSRDRADHSRRSDHRSGSGYERSDRGYDKGRERR